MGGASHQLEASSGLEQNPSSATGRDGLGGAYILAGVRVEVLPRLLEGLEELGLEAVVGLAHHAGELAALGVGANPAVDLAAAAIAIGTPSAASLDSVRPQMV